MTPLPERVGMVARNGPEKSWRVSTPVHPCSPAPPSQRRGKPCTSDYPALALRRPGRDPLTCLSDTPSGVSSDMSTNAAAVRLNRENYTRND
jgi:hypothetical protein